MSSSIEGKTCVVTGASSGIGEAIAAVLASRGGEVVGLARRFTAREPKPQIGTVSQVQVDVTDEQRVCQVFESIGNVDILVNNAGVGIFSPLWQTEVADLRAMLEVHVVGTFLCTREALRSMRAAGSGHIVNVSSVAATETFPSSSGYTAAKAGQLGLMRIARQELRDANVRVTSVLPGAVDTPIWDGRTGFDRSKMIKATDFAELIADIVAKPSLSVDEVTVVPPTGNL